METLGYRRSYSDWDGYCPKCGLPVYVPRNGIGKCKAGHDVTPKTLRKVPFGFRQKKRQGYQHGRIGKK